MQWMTVCRFNTPHTDNIQLETLGHKLQLAQDPNSKHVGTTVWDASMVFVKFLERNCKKGEFSSLRLRGKRVIELGSGCGLAGLGMALLGCHVVATDQVEVLPLLLRNVERNMARAKHSPSESPYLGPLGTIEVAELDWGNQQQIRALDPPFDYIIGTDIVYKEQLLEPLVATFLGLAGPKTSIMLGYEFRSSAVHEKMLQLWKQHFNVKIVPKAKMDSKYQHANIQLFNLRPKSHIASIAGSLSTKQRCDQEEAEAAHLEEKSEYLRAENMSSSSTTQPILTVNKNTQVSEIQEEGRELEETFPLSEADLDRKVTFEASSCSSGVSDWDIRRLGSMAARLMHDAL